MMPHSISRVHVVSGWFASVVVMFAGSVVAWGAQTTVTAGRLWPFFCLAPPAVMLIVWRAPAVTISELLYRVYNPRKDGRA
jgi:hypothetical protein